MTATTGWFVENAFNTKPTLYTHCTHITHMQGNITMFCLHIHAILYWLQEPQRNYLLQEGTLLTMLVLVTYPLPELMNQEKCWKVVSVTTYVRRAHAQYVQMATLSPHMHTHLPEPR